MAFPLPKEEQEVLQAKGGTPEIHKVFVVLNPVAGLTDANNARQTITQFCSEHGWECEIHETQKDEDLRHLVQDMIKQHIDMVIVSGGDGTVSEVVSGLVNSQVPLGVLPAGTGNSLARNLSIPLDLTGALNLLAGNHIIRVMDVMEVNRKKHFLLNVSAGVSARMMQETPRQDKRRFGIFAYIFRAIGSIRDSNMSRFQVKVDDQPIRVNASEVMIANSKLMGLQPQIDGVEVDPSDGQLDVFIMRANSFRDYLGVASAFLMRHKREQASKLNHYHAEKSIEIRAETRMPVQADGEVLGDTPVMVRLIRSALYIVTPGNSSGSNA